MGLVDIPKVSALIAYSQDTARRYFRKKIFHAHETGPDGVSLMSDERSVRIRFAALQRLRPELRSLDKLGRAFMSVAGVDDQFIMDRLKADASVEAVTQEFIAEVRAKLSK